MAGDVNRLFSMINQANLPYQVFEQVFDDAAPVVEAQAALSEGEAMALALRNVLGSSKVQSELLRRIQEGKQTGALTASMSGELGKLWQHCHRQVSKLERELAPPLEASFEEPAAERMREPGEDDE